MSVTDIVGNIACSHMITLHLPSRGSSLQKCSTAFRFYSQQWLIQWLRLPRYQRAAVLLVLRNCGASVTAGTSAQYRQHSKIRSQSKLPSAEDSQATLGELGVVRSVEQ